MRAHLLGLAMLLGAVAAGAPGLADQAPLCSSACTVGAHSLGYVTPATVVQSGEPVVWENLDGVPHVHLETPVASTTQPCFLVNDQGQTFSPSVTFAATPTGLQATTLDQDGQAQTRTCDNAVALPDGSYELAYHCTLHGQMRATLVVLP